VKAGIFFTTANLRELAADHVDKTKAYQKTQSSLVKEVVNIAGERFDEYWKLVRSHSAITSHLYPSFGVP
jgi:hypothetical protein